MTEEQKQKVFDKARGGKVLAKKSRIADIQFGYSLAEKKLEQSDKEIERLKFYQEVAMRLVEQIHSHHNSLLKVIDITNKDKQVLLSQNGISSERYEIH